MPTPASCRAVLGWEHRVWDVAASLGYVACDKYGLAQSAELRCGLACCWLGSCQYFQERGEGREGETPLPVPWLLTLPVRCWAAWGLPGPSLARGGGLRPSRRLLACAQRCLLLTGLEAERETH